jgi:hypothetical protein
MSSPAADEAHHDARRLYGWLKSDGFLFAESTTSSQLTVATQTQTQTIFCCVSSDSSLTKGQKKNTAKALTVRTSLRIPPGVLAILPEVLPSVAPDFNFMWQNLKTGHGRFPAHCVQLIMQ